MPMIFPDASTSIEAAREIFGRPGISMMLPEITTIFELGSICERPPPAAPPFISKPGPSEGSREVITTFLPMCASPCVRAIEVTVLPSPAQSALWL